MALTPWPESGADLNSAVSTLSSELGIEADERQKIVRLGASASAMVERYAPGAPDAVREQAVLMLAGYLKESPAMGLTVSLDSVRVSRSRHRTLFGALRLCGAMGLLSPWKVRRAGKVEASA